LTGVSVERRLCFFRRNSANFHTLLSAVTLTFLLAFGAASAVVAASRSHAAQTPAISNPPTLCQYPPSPTELKGLDGFTMAMCSDKAMRTWLGTEEDGIYCYDPAQPEAKRWKHYTTADGLGDNSCYAICCDRLGRIWAGSDRTGVSVFNGKAWKNFDQVTGPLGGHIYAMAASPVTGDVWMSTEGGLTRYSLRLDKWDNFIQPDGISLTQATAIAFNKRGDIVLGTGDSGIVIGLAAGNFTTWQQEPGPKDPPAAPIGLGLPSAQINCLATRLDGTLFAGTHDGLAKSTDGGFGWTYVRGADYLDKLNGLFASRRSRPTVSGIELMAPDTYTKLTSGQSGADPWVAIAAGDAPKDQLGTHITVTGGDTTKTGVTADISHASHPAPQSVYQGERQGDFFYSLSKLTPGGVYELRLHFSEMDYTGPHQRSFDVTVNGQPILRGFDIFSAAGHMNTAVVKDFPVKADGSGILKIQFAAPENAVADIAKTEAALGVKSQRLMSEDYVTCLAFSPDDRLYVGHWTKGIECYDIDDKAFLPVTEFDQTGKLKTNIDFVESVQSTTTGSAIVGAYGGPVHICCPTADFLQKVPAFSASHSSAIAAVLPSPAAPPTLGELGAIDESLKTASAKEMAPGDGAFLGEDWSTRGDWVGRYGSRRTVLFAGDAPFDHDIANDLSYTVHGDIGPNREERDRLRRWIEWLRTDDPRVLYDPVIGTRREAEYDDHAEDYPMSHEGPDVWITVDVPAGVHRLSAYMVNKDGHGYGNRDRDYLVELLRYQDDPWQSMELPVIASARVREFWDGVYVSFAVCGPSKFYLAVRKNNSFNAIISSVMIDKISGPPTPLEVMDEKLYKSPPPPSVFLMVPQVAEYTAPPPAPNITTLPTAKAATDLWPDFANGCGHPELASQLVAYQLLCYRALAAGALDPTIAKELTYWRRSLPYETDADRDNFKTAMAVIYKAEQRSVEAMASGNQW